MISVSNVALFKKKNFKRLQGDPASVDLLQAKICGGRIAKRLRDPGAKRGMGILINFSHLGEYGRMRIQWGFVNSLIINNENREIQLD